MKPGPDLEESASPADKGGANPTSGVANDVIAPFITTGQMREVDRAMIEDYGISLVQMMENAGRNLAQLARRRFLDGDPRRRRVLVLADSGRETCFFGHLTECLKGLRVSQMPDRGGR